LIPVGFDFIDPGRLRADVGQQFSRVAALKPNNVGVPIYRLCRSRKLHCYRAGRVLRIPLEEVERFGSESGTKPETPRVPISFKRHF
jgi:hypothetical protein